VKFCPPLAVAVLLMAGCAEAMTDPTVTERTDQVPHLMAIMALMEQKSVNRREIDWPTFRQEVLGSSDNAAFSVSIMHAMTKLSDPNVEYHLNASGTNSFAPTPPCSAPHVPQVGVVVPARIGYFHVPSFTGSVGQRQYWMTSLRNEIKRHDRNDLAGWIVDLRGNTRGEAWPALAAIGPLLGDGVAGHFIDPDGAITPWGYDGGAAFVGDHRVVEFEQYVIMYRARRIAVLVDDAVAAAGEILATAFLSQPHIRLFGRSSCGRALRAERFPLGLTPVSLTLSTAYLADRDMVRVDRAILPDEAVPGRDAAVARAIDWLENGH
jgi:carboxyl-terminal processing protease